MRNKQEYDINYQKENCKQVKILLNKKKDADVIDILAKKDNVNGFIKECIRDSKSTMTLQEFIQKAAVETMIVNVLDANGIPHSLDWYNCHYGDFEDLWYEIEYFYLKNGEIFIKLEEREYDRFMERFNKAE